MTKHYITLLQTLCFRGKCFLTCLYGRVEVMGFTIEEGQESYPLFSPASHCPLTIRALQSSDQTRDDRSEVLPILQKYLPSGKHISRRWCNYCVLWAFIGVLTIFLCPKCALGSVTEEVAKKNHVKLLRRPSGAHGDASDTVFDKLHRSQWIVQPPDGESTDIWTQSHS